MKTTGRFAALVVVLLVALAACTGDGEDGDGGPGPTNATAGSGPEADTGPTPVQGGPATRGTYEYVNGPLRVVLRIDGTTGTMEVDNGTDRELPRPDFYLLDARDGSEIEGEVDTPAPVPAGDTGTFDVSFEGIEVREIGAVVLLFGPDNYGLFVRTA